MNEKHENPFHAVLFNIESEKAKEDLMVRIEQNHA